MNREKSQGLSFPQTVDILTEIKIEYPINASQKLYHFADLLSMLLPSTYVCMAFSRMAEIIPDRCSVCFNLNLNLGDVLALTKWMSALADGRTGAVLTD
jgi:hypothetical protein